MTAAPATAAPRPVEGVLWMVACGLFFLGVNGVVRHLGPGIPAAQGAFLRFAFGVLFLAPTLIPLLRAGLPAGSLRLFCARGAVHVGAVVLWFHAMAHLPMAEVVAIGYLNPVVVSLAAAILYREGFPPRRIAAGLVAILGALVILRPGLREVGLAHLAQIGASVCFAGSYLAAARLVRIVPPAAVVAMLSLTVTLGLAPLAAAVWVPVEARQVAWLALVAAFASAAHYCMMRAFAAAPLTVTQPVTFLQLIWAAVLGWAVFGDAFDPWVLAGGGVILAAVVALTWREAALRSRTLELRVNAAGST